MKSMKRLLIVDDDHGLVNLLKRFLEAEGFTVDTAYDHADGLKAALAGRPRNHYPGCDVTGRLGI